MIARPLRRAPVETLEQPRQLHLVPPLAPLAPLAPTTPARQRKPLPPDTSVSAALPGELAPVFDPDTVPEGESAWFALATREPLCSRAEERELLARLERGRPRDAHGRRVALMATHSKRPGKYTVTTRYYRALTADARAAVDELVRRNLRLCIAPARRWEHVLRHLGHGMALDDVLAEASFGLLHGILKYDATTGNALSTCVIWWIRQACQRAVADQAHTIRVPVNHQRNAHLAALKETVHNVASLDKPLSGVSQVVGWHDQDVTLLDGLPDADAEAQREGFEEQVAQRQLLDELRTAARLNEREWLVLCLRFGLDEHPAGTLEEAGAALGITREGARLIERGAIQKLRKVAARDASLLAAVKEVVG